MVVWAKGNPENERLCSFRGVLSEGGGEDGGGVSTEKLPPPSRVSSEGGGGGGGGVTVLGVGSCHRCRSQ